MANWVAMFSRSGQEIADISTCIGRSPDLIMTTNIDHSSWSPTLRDQNRFVPIMAGHHIQLMQFLEQTWQSRAFNYQTIITLHGYMRIIPSHICKMYDMYNGHPGLITLYPDLKGKDPQQKVLDNPRCYSKIGSVVHRVTAGVDEGRVITSHSINYDPSFEDLCQIQPEALFETLRQESLDAWLEFFDIKGFI